MKIKLLLILLCLICTASYSQISFQNNIITDSSNYGTSISGSNAADIDGDGDLDLIAYYYEGNFVWFENKPSEGGLVNPKVIHQSVNGSNSSPIAIDIDNDGDMDVVASTSSEIFWYENLDGLGNFGNYSIITTQVGSVSSLDYHDLDNDGDLDILSSSSFDDKIAWYENVDGIGGFGPQQVISESSILSTNVVYAEDMDGDGDADIIANFNRLYWLENIGGTFTTQHQISSESLTSFFPVDLDNDGDIDLVIPEGYSDDLVWYENIDGLGNFGPEIMIDPTIDGDVHDAFANDIDGDGDLDIIVSALFIYYYINDGNQNFSGGLNILSSSSSGGAIFAADFDNDGDKDVISGGYINGKQGILYSEFDQANDAFKQERLVGGPLSGPIGNFPADMDNDGDLDILVASNGDNKITWFEDVDGNQNFSTHHIISNTVNDPTFVMASDIDNDGDMDVFVPSKTDDKIVWFKNQGNGSFTNELILTTETNGPDMIDIVDIDNDGDLDILSVSYNDDKVAWYENLDGLGNFGTQQIISTDSNGPTSVYGADIDNDGNIDVVITSYIDNEISWFKNLDGLGNFSVKQLIDSGGFSKMLAIGDIDNDGDLDILAPSAGNNDFSWFENEDGNGQFGNDITIDFSSSPVVSLADIDGDGDLDALGITSSRILWYENVDGFSTASADSPIINIGGFDKHFITKDMDFDGDIDVISTREENDQLAYSKNLGALGNEINGTVQVDINGDGCDDLDAYYSNIMVVATNGSDSFATFTLNNGSYQIPVNSGNFTTSIGGDLPSYFTPNPLTYDFNFSGLGNVETANFCIEPNQSISDVNISVFPLTQARPGFDVTYRIVYKNVGTEQLDGTIDFQFDNTRLNFLNASETTSSQTTNTLTFNYSDLNSYESRTIDVMFNVWPPPTVNIDEVISLVATINPVSGDFTEIDNVFSFNQTVIGSYDPNDIRCLEGQEILLADADKYLHYLIRFQNTGTASAINIRVDNTLDDKLDWTTLQIETTSHLNRVEIKDGNELSFIFSGINLPYSTLDEGNSHGFIAYKIKPKNDVSEGDIFLNTADIYFDFNEAIVTNTAMTEIVGALSVNEFNQSTFKVFPNPTTGILNIQSKNQILQIEMYNSLGQQILILEGSKDVDISKVETGIYFMTIQDINGNQETIKVIKQ